MRREVDGRLLSSSRGRSFTTLTTSVYYLCRLQGTVGGSPVDETPHDGFPQYVDTPLTPCSKPVSSVTVKTPINICPVSRTFM